MNSSVFRKFTDSFKKFEKTQRSSKNLRIAVALSGGVDSITLLDLLVKVKREFNSNLQIHAITVDHGLRPESSIESHNLNDSIIKNMKYPVIHSILKIDTQINKRKVELHARELRYSLIFNYCNKHDIGHLFLGHHQDDQLETFVMRLLSNSTIFGLRGIKFENVANLDSLNKTCLIRPMLNSTKHDIYEYAKMNGLTWFEDVSNDDHNLTRRNLIRKILNDDRNSVIKQQLITNYNRLTELLDASVYDKLKELNDVGSYSDIIEAEYKFNKYLFSLDMNFKVCLDTAKYINSIDYIILNRFLFNKIWQVSPSRNYLYGFTKFDNVNTVLSIPHDRDGNNLFETFLKSDTGKLTIAGCVVEWSTEVSKTHRNINVSVYRERLNRKNSHVPNTLIDSRFENSYFYDNRMFIVVNCPIDNNNRQALMIQNFDSNKFSKKDVFNFLEKCSFKEPIYSIDVTNDDVLFKLLCRYQLPVATVPDTTQILAIPTLGMYSPMLQNEEISCVPKTELSFV